MAQHPEHCPRTCRYRTQLCNDGAGCRRRICFFAHSLDELRVPSSKPFVSPEALAASTATATAHAVHRGGLGALNEHVSTPLPCSHHCDMGEAIWGTK